MYYIIKCGMFYTGCSWTIHKHEADLFSTVEAKKLAKSLRAKTRLEWDKKIINEKMNKK